MTHHAIVVKPQPSYVLPTWFTPFQNEGFITSLLHFMFCILDLFCWASEEKNSKAWLIALKKTWPCLGGKVHTSSTRSELTPSKRTLAWLNSKSLYQLPLRQLLFILYVIWSCQRIPVCSRYKQSWCILHSKLKSFASHMVGSSGGAHPQADTAFSRHSHQVPMHAYMCTHTCALSCNWILASDSVGCTHIPYHLVSW